MLVRCDSAGSTQNFLGHLAEAGVGFSVSARLTDGVRAAIRIAHARPADIWMPAVRQDGEVRDRAHVTEVTGLVDLSAYPVGTRVLAPCHHHHCVYVSMARTPGCARVHGVRATVLGRSG